MGASVSTDFRSLKAKIRHMERVLTTGVDKIVADATKVGADEMRRIIETSATPAKKAGLWSSRWHITNMEGRIETGHMLRSVTDVHTRFTGAWGWALNGGVAEPYFTYQNYGFRHNVTGKQIPGMNALLGSFLKAREQLIRDLDELVK